ncbi:unnamed protein product, partial [Staurois parvus]
SASRACAVGTWLSQPGAHSTSSPSLPKGLQSLVIPYTVCSLWSSPVLSAVSDHCLYYVRSLWSSPVLCPQSPVIPCTVSAVSGHPLYCVRRLWSSPVPSSA